MTTRTLHALLAAVLLAAPAWAQEMHGTIEGAGRGASTDKSPNLAAEYLDTDGGAELRAAIQGLFDTFALALEADVRSDDNQHLALSFDVNRLVRSHTTFTRLPHRLVHDPLDNLGGSISDVKVVWSTDLEPAAAYAIRFSELTNRNEFQIESLPWLTVGTDVREQWREGHRQSLAVSHCSTCHVQSQGREVNEHTREAGIQARAVFGGWSLAARVANRDLRERAPSPQRVYELVEHPAQRTPLFRDRMQYDARNGALAYDVVPSTKKDIARVELANPNLAGFAVNLTGIRTDLTNASTGNEVEYRGASLLLARRVGKVGNFSLRARTYTIDSTDTFVDAVEPPAVAGPYAGKTYRERYGLDPDFLRQSAIDRTVNEATARYVHRLGRGASLQAQYDVRAIDRDTYQVAPGETATLEQRLRLAYHARPIKGLTVRAAASYGNVQHPFAIVDGACNLEPLQTTPTASPIVPGSVQYWQIHDARSADLSASPASFLELKLSGTYQLGASSMATLSLRTWDGDNTEQDLNQWSRTLSAATATWNWAPAEDATVYVAATYGSRKLEQHVCIPLMDG